MEKQIVNELNSIELFLIRLNDSLNNSSRDDKAIKREQNYLSYIQDSFYKLYKYVGVK